MKLFNSSDAGSHCYQLWSQSVEVCQVCRNHRQLCVLPEEEERTDRDTRPSRAMYGEVHRKAR
jgi:hypothetical protein